MILQGNCLELLREMEDNSIDSIVTDPPYGLSACKPEQIRVAVENWIHGRDHNPGGKGFMGKEWDSFVPGPEVWKECLRVLKPGGHIAAFAGSRTVDLMGLAIRLAGFEVRDQLQWIYGSGFPKSLDVSKAIDKSKGAEREVVGRYSSQLPGGHILAQDEWSKKHRGSSGERGSITTPATDLAKQWDGWGTALKPAHEPIILARKPLIGTVAKNVEEHGTGGINVDGCRVEGPKPKMGARTSTVVGANSMSGASTGRTSIPGAVDNSGRWPANIILDEEAGEMLDVQSGTLKSGSFVGTVQKPTDGVSKGKERSRVRADRPSDTGGASRFFYCAKASKKEREQGLEHLPNQRRTDGRESDIENPRLRTSERKNTHPTVKPISLMRWLVRLITPPGGTVLDPFTGSGSTGIAAKLDGFEFVGCELSEEYVAIANARIESWKL